MTSFPLPDGALESLHAANTALPLKIALAIHQRSEGAAPRACHDTRVASLDSVRAPVSTSVPARSVPSGAPWRCGDERRHDLGIVVDRDERRHERARLHRDVRRAVNVQIRHLPSADRDARDREGAHDRADGDDRSHHAREVSAPQLREGSLNALCGLGAGVVPRTERSGAGGRRAHGRGDRRGRGEGGRTGGDRRRRGDRGDDRRAGACRSRSGAEARESGLFQRHEEGIRIHRSHGDRRYSKRRACRSRPAARRKDVGDFRPDTARPSGDATPRCRGRNRAMGRRWIDLPAHRVHSRRHTAKLGRPHTGFLRCLRGGFSRHVDPRPCQPEARHSPRRTNRLPVVRERDFRLLGDFSLDLSPPPIYIYIYIYRGDEGRRPHKERGDRQLPGPADARDRGRRRHRRPRDPRQAPLRPPPPRARHLVRRNGARAEAPPPTPRCRRIPPPLPTRRRAQSTTAARSVHLAALE